MSKRQGFVNLVLRIVQGLLAVSCVVSGVLKAFWPLATVPRLFPWASHVATTLVRVIGISELLAGIGLVLPSALVILPWLTVAAAAGLVLLMLCAALFHAWRREFPPIGTTIVLLVLTMFIVIGWWIWVYVFPLSQCVLAGQQIALLPTHSSPRASHCSARYRDHARF